MNKNQANDSMRDEDAWIGLTGENFKIRSCSYLKDRKKVFSKECVFKCLCCELINSKEPLCNYSARPKSLVQKLRAEGYDGCVYVYNIMVPSSINAICRLNTRENMLA